MSMFATGRGAMTRRGLPALCALALAAGPLLAAPAFRVATISFDSLVWLSDLIVVATVTSVERGAEDRTAHAKSLRVHSAHALRKLQRLAAKAARNPLGAVRRVISGHW